MKVKCMKIMFLLICKGSGTNPLADGVMLSEVGRL